MNDKTDAITESARIFASGDRTMLGCDGSTVEEAVEAAYAPTGPPRSELREWIGFRRAHPTASTEARTGRVYAGGSVLEPPLHHSRMSLILRRNNGEHLLGGAHERPNELVLCGLSDRTVGLHPSDDRPAVLTRQHRSSPHRHGRPREDAARPGRGTEATPSGCLGRRAVEPSRIRTAGSTPDTPPPSAAL